MWAFVGCVLALFAFYNISNHCTQRYVSQQGAHPEKYIQEMYTLYNVQGEIYETQYELCVYKQFEICSKCILQYVYSTYRMQQILCLFPCSVWYVDSQVKAQYELCGRVGSVSSCKALTGADIPRFNSHSPIYIMYRLRTATC